MGAYLSRHAQVCISAIGKLVSTPVASIMTILVIAITLCLPAALHLMVRNGLELTGGWEVASDISVYLTPGASLESAEATRSLLAGRADIETIELITADAALAAFKTDSGFGAALDSLSALVFWS